MSNGHQSTADEKKYVFNLVVLLVMNEPFEHCLHNLTIVEKFSLDSVSFVFVFCYLKKNTHTPLTFISDYLLPLKKKRIEWKQKAIMVFCATKKFPVWYFS